MEKYNQFITANTLGVEAEEIRQEHVIPVHLKDNEPMISHNQFIDAVCIAGADVFGPMDKPMVRVSHPIKGRIPEARSKPSKELLPHETTLFYERLAWTASFPSITKQFGNEELCLTIGGVKAYNLDNSYSTKGTDEHFKLFVGFRNSVCTNLCVSTDGYMNDLKVNDASTISSIATTLFQQFNCDKELKKYKLMQEVSLTEKEFAHVLGRVKLYNAMPVKEKKQLPSLGISDSQLNTVAEEYYSDPVHGRSNDGRIDLWRMYNLLTSANKSSYIDRFMDRNVKMYEGISALCENINLGTKSFYLN